MADVTARELLEDQRRVEARETSAAMLLGRIDAAKAKLAERFQLGAVEEAFLIPLGRVRPELIHGEIVRHVGNHRLFFSQKRHGLNP